jgi:hypothetical protein
MRVADLAVYLSQATDEKTRWKTFWEFLEEFRWESPATQIALLMDEPPSVGDERWDALLAALAEHLAAKHDLAPPGWTEQRVLARPWFPAELRVQRADALVHAPAAFRKHGVYLAAADLEAA